MINVALYKTKIWKIPVFDITSRRINLWHSDESNRHNYTPHSWLLGLMHHIHAQYVTKTMGALLLMTLRSSTNFHSQLMKSHNKCYHYKAMGLHNSPSFQTRRTLAECLRHLNLLIRARGRHAYLSRLTHHTKQYWYIDELYIQYGTQWNIDTVPEHCKKILRHSLSRRRVPQGTRRQHQNPFTNWHTALVMEHYDPSHSANN